MPVDLKKDDMGDVVKDFYKSDAPQFKGKSKKKRREMAIAAKLSAESALHFQEQERHWSKGYDSGDKTVPRRKALDRAEYFDNRGENERAHKIRRIAISKDHGETHEARKKAKNIKISDKVGKLRPASIDDKRGAVSGDVQKKLTDSFEIDKTKFKAIQKKQKMRNLAIKNPNKNEADVAHKKAGGPKLIGESPSILKVRGKRNTYMGASGDHRRDKEGNIKDSFYKKKPAPQGEKSGERIPVLTRRGKRNKSPMYGSQLHRLRPKSERGYRSEGLEEEKLLEKLGSWKQDVKDRDKAAGKKYKKKSINRKKKWREGGNEKLKDVNKPAEKQSMQAVGGFRGVHGSNRKSKAAQGKPAPVVYSYKKKEVSEGKLERVMDTVRKYTSGKKPERKAQKAMDAGARAKRLLQRKEYASKVSGSTDNVPDDIRDHKIW